MKNWRFFLLFGVLAFSGINALAQTQSEKLDWTVTSSGSRDTYNALIYQDAVVDEAGNTYASGSFSDTSYDYYGFVSKFDSHGNQLWYIPLRNDGATGPIPCLISLDKKGHIYVTDLLSEPGIITKMDCGNNISVTTNNTSDWQMFVACYDTTGNAEWATAVNGSYPSILETDSEGNCLISDRYYFSVLDSKGTVDFSDSFITDGYYEIENMIWDKNHNLYALGTYSEDLKIDNNPVHHFDNSPYQLASFLVKYAPDNKVKWVKYFEDSTGAVFFDAYNYHGGSVQDDDSYIGVDNNGNVFLMGNFTSNYINTFPYPITYKYSDSSYLMVDSFKLSIHDRYFSNVFVICLDSVGKARWAHSIADTVSAYNATADLDGNFYVAGNFKDTLIGGIANKNGFIIKYDKNGKVIWEKGIGNDFARIFSENNSDKILMMGYNTGEYDQDLKLIWTVGVNYVSYTNFIYRNSLDFIVIAGGYLNELSPFSCTAPSAILSAKGKVSYCTGDTINVIFKAKTDTGTAIMWIGRNTIISNAYDTILHVTTAGDYYFLSTNKSGCQAVSNSVSVNVNPLPSAPTITKHGDSLTSSAKSGNQWYRDSVLIKGATDQKYVATTSGNYSVMVTDTNGCLAMSANLNYTVTGMEEMAGGINVEIYPNPFSNSVNIGGTLNENGNVSFSVYDMTGRLITTQSDINHPAGKFKSVFDAEKYECQDGMYILKLTVGNNVITREIVHIR